MLLIFCQVGPGLYEWGPAAGGQTVCHSESPCWKGFVVWGLCLVADTDLWHKETIYCSYRGHKNSCNRKTTVWLVFIGPLPGSAQFCQSFSVDYFQAWQWCQTRVHECMVVTPGDKANPSPGGNIQDVKYVSWYLRRATLSGFTYRNSQWDGDSRQCPLDFTLGKDVTGAQS